MSTNPPSPGAASTAPDLRPLLVPLADLEEHPANARRGVVPAIAASLERFGQTKPIRVQKSRMRIVAGHHVAAAARSLGWAEVAAVVEDMSDDDALAYMLTDNRLADRATYDTDSLVGVLDRLQAGGGLAATGWDADALDSLRAQLGDSERPVVAHATEADYAEAEQDAEARRSAPASPFTEVVLVYSAADYDRYVAALGAAQAALGTSGVKRTVVAALERTLA